MRTKKSKIKSLEELDTPKGREFLSKKCIEIQTILNYTGRDMAKKIGLSQTKYQKTLKESLIATYEIAFRMIIKFKLNLNWFLTEDPNVKYYINEDFIDIIDVLKNIQNDVNELSQSSKEKDDLQKKINKILKMIDNFEKQTYLNTKMTPELNKDSIKAIQILISSIKDELL